MSQRGEYRLGLLDGDGIGGEIVPAAAEVTDAALHAAGAPPVRWVSLPMGLAAIDEFGTSLPDSTVTTLAGLDGWLLGPHDNAAYPVEHRATLNPSGSLRKRFDLFANIRPARSLPHATERASDTDLVIVRENTEGFYADRNTHAGSGEFMPTPDVAIAHGIVTRSGTERIARTAFELARKRRRKVTVAHKANVLRTTSGLFLDTCRTVAAEYPDVEVGDEHIDAMTVHLLRRTSDFDVIVTENMFGDILSDLTGELAGSLGTAPSVNAGHGHAMAQATHGSAPDIAGRDIANPVAMILSAAMLLDRLGDRHGDDTLSRSARLVEDGVYAALSAGSRTPDLGGHANTTELTHAITSAIRATS